MAVPFIHTSFAGGEIAPSLFGHVDLARFNTAAATLRNMFVGYRGGANSRAGTAYVGRSKQNAAILQPAPRLVQFDFNLNQQYTLEFGNGYIRFVFRGGFVLETAFSIVDAVPIDPCEIQTSTAHNFNNGDWVVITGVTGMVEVNDTWIVTASNQAAGILRLTNLSGTPLNATHFAAYAGGGSIARIYEIASPYNDAALDNLKWAQSADVLTITHPNYPPYDLKRFGPTNWTITPTSFGTSLAAPASCSVSATTNPDPSLSPPTLPTAYAYEVTAIDPKTGEESQPSPVGNVTDSVDIAATAGSLIVTWAPVAGATAGYNIYKAPPSYNTDPGNTSDALPVPAGALFGLAGFSFGNQFVDSNVTTDFTHSPPQHQNPLAPGQVISITMTSSSSDWSTATVGITTSTGSGAVLQAVIVNSEIVAVIVVSPGQNYVNGTDTATFTGDGTSATGTLNIGPATGTYPSLVSYFQQRRVFASSLNQPDTYWMSQPGAIDNFDTSIPVIDSDAITGTPSQQTVDGIQWMIEMPLGLVTFTGSIVMQITASGTFLANPVAITPTTQIALPQSTVGSSATLAPTRVNFDLLHFEPNNATLRELDYQIYFNIYVSRDITWQSSHLTEGYQIVDRAWARQPNYILWMARDDGLFLSMTYLKEQEVTGWAKHTTQGQVCRLCAITELPVDALYLAVRRFPPDGEVYMIERMNDRLWQSNEDPWCVDAGVGTTLPTAGVQLFASAPSGNAVTFTTSGAIFSAGHVGQTLRMGGGIAVVTAYVDATHVIGNWVFPCQQLLPEYPTPVAMPQAPGKWSIAPNITTLYGLRHLAGMDVVGLADGVPVGPFLVSDTGSITLPFPASDIKIGLPFTAQIQSVYLETGQQPTIQGRRKSINAVTVRCKGSAPMQAGANEIDASTQSPPPLFATWTNLAAVPAQPDQLPTTYTSPGGGTVQPNFTGDIRIPIKSGWARPGQVAAQQTLPVPLNVLDFVLEGLEGDMPEQGYTPRQQQQRPPGRIGLLPA